MLSIHLLRRAQIILLIIGFISLTLGLIGNFSPLTHYDSSIYSSVPLPYWIAFFLSAILGITLIFTNKNKKLSNLCPLLLISVSLISFLLLPLYRGYSIYGRWDILTHLGIVKDILDNGVIGNSNVYPASHIILANLSITTGLQSEFLFLLLIPIVSIFVIISIIALGIRFGLKDYKLTLVICTAFLPLLNFLNFQVFPNWISVSLIPLFLFLYIARSSSSHLGFSVGIILIVIVTPIFHPLTAAIMIVAFIFIDLVRLIFRKLKYIEIEKNIHHTIAIDPTLILIIAFFVWISINTKFWSNSVTQISSWFAGEATAPNISSSIMNIFSILGIGSIDVLVVFVLMYGTMFILLLISLFGLLRTLFALRKQSVPYLSQLIILYSWVALTAIIFIINLVMPVGRFGIWRIIALMVIILPVLFAYILGDIGKSKRSQIKKAITYSIIILMFIISIFSCYPSPLIYQPNQQVNASEIVGMEWQYSFKDPMFSDKSIRSSFRFADLILGFNEAVSRSDIPRNERLSTIPKYMPPGLIEDHFLNITNNESYLIIPIFDEEFYLDVYPQIEEFNKYDFQNISINQNVSRIYSSAVLKIYKV